MLVGGLHQFPDRGQELIEAETDEEGTEAFFLRDAAFKEERAKGHPACGVVIAASCGIEHIEEVEHE